jgi:hypothetical protein
MGLYDRDYMKWTDAERASYLGGGTAARAGSHAVVLFTVVGMLVASAAGAHFGFGVGLPALHWGPHVPSRSEPVGCVGPSTMRCPPGTLRIPDPNDPYNPHEWPSDLRQPAESSSA